MLDLSNLPNAANGADVQIFYATGPSDWQTWVKPRGKSMIGIFAFGAGGGGGGGCSGAAGTARGGGGAGASGATFNTIIPAIFLPDTLFVNVGLGGAGGAADTVGLQGGMTNVFVYPLSGSSGPADAIVSAFPGGPGSPGTSSAAGAGGSGGSAYTAAISALGSRYSSTNRPGNAGGAQTGAAGTNATFNAVSSPLCAGAGGGGLGTANTDFAGGSVLSSSNIFPASPGGLAMRGTDGVFRMTPFGSSGGAGGSTNSAGTGYGGGNAGLGSGGGGGGAGLTGGAGGTGGHGLVVIVSW